MAQGLAQRIMHSLIMGAACRFPDGLMHHMHNLQQLAQLVHSSHTDLMKGQAQALHALLTTAIQTIWRCASPQH